MYAKTIVYDDLDGNKQSEVWHFQLNKGTIYEMTMRYGEALWLNFSNLTDGEKVDGNGLVEAFRILLSNSVGRRVGQRFQQSQEITDEFMQTGAYSEFLVELLQNPDMATDFFKTIIPASVVRDFEEASAATKKTYTFNELVDLTQDEFDRVAGIDPKKWSRLELQAAMKRHDLETAA